VHVTQGSLDHGFVAERVGLVVLTGDDLAGQRSSTKDMRRMPARRRKQIDPLELRSGDFVVHELHGVGRYVEMTQRTVAGATREYLVLEYAPAKRGQPADRLYVPTDQLDQVTRYVGGEHPSLDRLGGSDWAKRKGRARKAVRQIAAELIKLYAARQATRGHAFSADTPWQRELEDAFPFVETPDQLSTVEEVKRDMEQPVPMDRLVCGDVGYGKTEIAVRAAFKAVQDGKQVAVLVPTTLLVSQHYSTFAERFAGFPVIVRPLSRFKTDSEARAVLDGLRDGTIDVVVGTHRLLSPDVSPAKGNERGATTLSPGPVSRFARTRVPLSVSPTASRAGRQPCRSDRRLDRVLSVGYSAGQAAVMPRGDRMRGASASKLQARTGDAAVASAPGATLEVILACLHSAPTAARVCCLRGQLRVLLEGSTTSTASSVNTCVRVSDRCRGARLDAFACSARVSL
jgi:hypothetical protein